MLFNKMNKIYTTLSEHFQNPMKNASKEAKSIPLTLKYNTTCFSRLIQELQ